MIKSLLFLFFSDIIRYFIIINDMFAFFFKPACNRMLIKTWLLCAGSATINNYPLHRECYTVPGLTRCFQTPARWLLYRRPRHFIRLGMPGWLCPRCDAKTPGKSLRIGLLFSILAKTKESDKWGRRKQWRICWLSLVVRDTPRGMVITGGEPCIRGFAATDRPARKERFNCQIETSGTHERYAAHRMHGLPYRQSWTCAAAMKHCRKHWSEPTETPSGARYAISKLTGWIAGDADRW